MAGPQLVAVDLGPGAEDTVGQFEPAHFKADEQDTFF